jgi:ATP-dependent 26S proteasome regulatory subunit
MIDSAVLRRGRFDHAIEVDYASESEVLSLLEYLLLSLPGEEDLDPRPLAASLANRPLSDVAFVVREGARLAARAGKRCLDQASLRAAMELTPARQPENQQRIGFV